MTNNVSQFLSTTEGRNLASLANQFPQGQSFGHHKYRHPRYRESHWNTGCNTASETGQRVRCPYFKLTEAQVSSHTIFRASPPRGSSSVWDLGSFRIAFVPQLLRETDPTPLRRCGKRSCAAHSTAHRTAADARSPASAPHRGPGCQGRRAGGGARPVTRGHTHQSERPAAPAQPPAHKKSSGLSLSHFTHRSPAVLWFVALQPFARGVRRSLVVAPETC